MRYPAAEKLEIIRLVEQSALPVRRTLEKIGIPRATFYRWYDLYQSGGPEALDDRHPKPDRVWNRIPDDVRERIVNLALDESALSPRELAVRFTDTEGYFVSEASVYRLLKAHDLIASPAFIVMKAADEFQDKTTAPNQLWQTIGSLPFLLYERRGDGGKDRATKHPLFRLIHDRPNAWTSAAIAWRWNVTRATSLATAPGRPAF